VADRRSPLFWAATWGLIYLVASVAVTFIEYRNEVSKLSRGTFTDTVSPYFYANVATFPTSSFVAHWPGYPGDFDEARWKAALHDGLWPHLEAAAIQTAVLVLVVYVVIRRRRRA
jgi:hypothetical protein